MPATIKVSEASQRQLAFLRSSAAAVAVERYRLKHDNLWPRSLKEVVKAGLLKEIPKDPYDGQPLRFKRTPTGLVVYSLGPDKTDNGGVMNRGNPTATNTDIGFELWDLRFRSMAAPLEEQRK